MIRRLLAPALALLLLDMSTAAAEWLERHAPYLPETRQQTTRSGGLHLFFRHVEGLRNSAFIKSDELYAAVTRGVAAWTQSVDQFNAGPIFAAPQAYESLNGMARELEKTVREFRGNPKKYMRLKVF